MMNEHNQFRMCVKLPDATQLIASHDVARMIAEQLGPGRPSERMVWLMKLEASRQELVYRWFDGLPVPKSTQIGGINGERGAYILAADLSTWLKQLGYSVEHEASNGGPADVPAPLPRQRQQEAAIIAKLQELGFDPLKLPPIAKGGDSPAKSAVRLALGSSQTKAVFDKAWKRLQQDVRIKYV